MKRILFFPATILFISFFNTSGKAAPGKLITDTSVINHELDGSTLEWPDEKFETDKETNIKYAIDNDKEKLFLAMRIADFRTQMKMMRMGMNLYIDLKGKKKEGRGIEFPVKPEGGGSSGGGFSNRQNNEEGEKGNDRQKGFDMKAVRNSMALNLIFMKIFGFNDDEPKAQGLQMENTANIAFNWDSSNVMHIEYSIPLKMLDENISSLNQKNISVGWKINGVDLSSNSSPTFGNSTSGINSGSRGGGRGGGGFNRGGSGGSGPSQADMDKMMREQSFWTKYTFGIQ